MKFKLNKHDEIPLLPEIIEEDDDDNSIAPIQRGQSALNNIEIDENALNKNIIKIRYLNGIKLNK